MSSHLCKSNSHRKRLLPKLSLLLHLFILAFSTIACSSQSNFNTGIQSFLKRLETFEVINGGRAELPCYPGVKLTASDYTNVSWIKMPRRLLTRGLLRVTQDSRVSLKWPSLSTTTSQLMIPSSSSSSLEEINFQLVIDPVRPQDAGEYRCTFQLGSSSIRHKSVILIVKVPPYFVTRPQALVETESGGQVIKLLCNASGLPAPQVRWWQGHPSRSRSLQMATGQDHHQSMALREAVQVAAGDIDGSKVYQGHHYEELDDALPIETLLNKYRKSIYVRGGLLMFTNVDRQLDGWYFCEAYNGLLPPAIAVTRLVVHYRPEVKVISESINRQLGSNILLGCVIRANPLGKVEWELNGVPIKVIPCRQHNPVKYCQIKRRPLVVNSNDNLGWSNKQGPPTTLSNQTREQRIDLELSIVNISQSDLGLYTCRMTNRVGSGEAYTRLKEERKRFKKYGSITSPSESRLMTSVLGSELASSDRSDPTHRGRHRQEGRERTLDTSSIVGRRWTGQTSRRSKGSLAKRSNSALLYLLHFVTLACYCFI